MEAAGVDGVSIHVWAASGGHGGTTVAGALAAFLGASVWSHDEDAYEWMWGKSVAPSLRRATIVHDAGVITGLLPDGQSNVVVLRGPCSLAVRKLAHRSDSMDHLVLVREPWRPLRTQDVEDALGVGVDAEVQFSPRVARLADSGLLSVRVVGLTEFAGLKAWAEEALAVS